jgi:dTDP-4-dehydrorhamnose 3,5-epimerase
MICSQDVKGTVVIKDIQLVPLVARVDDRGYLIEILHATDEHFTQFGQVYLVGNPTRGTTRAFHKHKELWDWFFISHGSAKFVLRDDRPESETYGEINEFVIGQRNPSLLIVPPGVYHGWMSLEDDTQLVSTASEVYNRENPDEIRRPPDSFGVDWTVKGR